MTRTQMKEQLEIANKLIAASDRIVEDSNNAINLFKSKLESIKRDMGNQVKAYEEKIAEIEEVVRIQTEGKEAAKIIFDQLSEEIKKAEDSVKKD